jgi:hypothetical protein
MIIFDLYSFNKYSDFCCNVITYILLLTTIVNCIEIDIVSYKFPRMLTLLFFNIDWLRSYTTIPAAVFDARGLTGDLVLCSLIWRFEYANVVIYSSS